MILTSHIGSLPFTSISESIDFNLRFTIPCKFSLPKLFDGDFMQNEVFGEFNSFDRELFNQKFSISDYKLVFKSFYKNQIMGPITSFILLKNAPIEEFKNWYLKNLKNLLKTEQRELCYFFLDEPMLYLATDQHFQLLEDIMSAVKGSIYSLGIHSCSKFNISHLNQHLLDSISIESLYYDEYGLFKSLEVFLGVLSPSSLKLDPVIDIDHNKVYLTPNCGLGLTHPRKVQIVPDLLQKWGKMTLLK